MNSYSFLHPGMRASALKREWDKDTPLRIDDGGTMGSIGLWTSEQLSETLRKQPGSKVQALGCLTQLSNDLSCPHLTILGNTIEDVGRHLWTSRIEVSPDDAGPDMLLGMEGEKVTDTYWKDHAVSFPDAWPEKANLAVSIIDPDAWPGKHRLLNNDPIVLSFLALRRTSAAVAG